MSVFLNTKIPAKKRRRDESKKIANILSCLVRHRGDAYGGTPQPQGRHRWAQDNGQHGGQGTGGPTDQTSSLHSQRLRRDVLCVSDYDAKAARKTELYL